jgi:amino acid adenylation domain-containing protein
MDQKIIQYRLFDAFGRYADNCALQCDDRKISYHELDRLSNRVASAIMAKNPPISTHIGVLLEDRIHFISVIIGILKAGAVFVPLSTATPRDRQLNMIENTDIKFIIGTTDALQLIGNDLAGTDFIDIDEILASPKTGDTAFSLPREYDPEDSIYIFFTSGTTGIPKAISGKNKSLTHFLDWEIETLNVNQTFRTSQLINPTFDAILRDIFVPLLSGATIMIPPANETALEPHELALWINQAEVQLIHCSPILLRNIIAGVQGNDWFQSLKYILLSGQRIDPGLLEQWYTIFNDRVQLVNLWGTSETTMSKTCYFISPQDVTKERVPVGKAIKGSRIIVMDNERRLCGQMEVGEVYIRTPYRTHGYYKNDAANHQWFLKNPFNENPQDLLHRTGDLGRLLMDGNLDIMGRIDRQVKIRGIRVELEEIETVLTQHPEVKEAAIVRQALADDINVLWGFVTSQSNPLADQQSWIEQLLQFLREKLPDYMVPAMIFTLDEFPRTPGGKIDYQAMKKMAQEAEKQLVLPENKLEEDILRLWEQILKNPAIGVTDHFFQLGGNSLNVMTLISKIHQEFDVRLSLAQVFNNPSIKKMANLISQARPEIFISIESSEEREYYPLSSAQMRLYLMQQIEPDNLSYNISQFFELVGDIQVQHLDRIINTLIQRHECLRTSFLVIRDQPVQRIHNKVPPILEYSDLWQGDHVSQNIDREIQNRIDGFVKPFELSRAPLMRVALIRKEKDRHIFMFDMHHIITDGTSETIFAQEFIALYEEVRLPPLKFHYRDYSMWHNRKLLSRGLKEQEDYWTQLFKDGIPPFNLPTDFPRPPFQSFEGHTVMAGLDDQMSNNLVALANQHNVTVYMLVLSLFAILLSRLSGQEDIVLGADIAGRNHLDLHSIIGMFVNTVVYKIPVKKDRSFVDFLGDVRQLTLGALENQDYQFDELVKKMGVKKEPNRNPLFDIMFSFPDFESRSEIIEKKNKTKISDLKMRPLKYEAPISKFDMNIKVVQRPNLTIVIEYCTKLFKHETIDRFINYFIEIASHTLENNTIILKDIKISHNLVAVASRINEIDLEF